MTSIGERSVDLYGPLLAYWARRLVRPDDAADLVQKNPDFASIRDKAELEKLPADEQKAFKQFCADVAALLKKAELKRK